MSVIPIDEAALAVAAAKFRNHNTDGSYLSIEERLSAAVSAYLSAIGAEVEYRGEAWDDGEAESDATEAVATVDDAERDLRVLQEDCDPPYEHTRIAECWVSSWRPLTTTEEETDGR